MKNSKGFTLVEILGVLVILAIIFIVAFPSVISHIISGQNAVDNSASKLVIEGAKDFVAENDINRKIEKYCIGVEELIDDGYVDEKNIDDSIKAKSVEIGISTDKLTYTLVDECSMTGNGIISINGNSRVEVNINTPYVDEGATATDKNSNDISSSIVTKIYDKAGNIVNSINTATTGIYHIEYSVMYNGIEDIVYRDVKVVDREKPVITVTDPEVDLAYDAGTFNLLEGVTVADNSGEVLNLSVKTNLTLGIPGIYYVNYSAKDSSGNEASAIKFVLIGNLESGVETPLFCFTYREYTDSVYIRKYSSDCPKKVAIPRLINSKKVTIGESAFKNKGLTEVMIPDTIASIGYSAFEDNNLTSLVLPSSVKDIGRSAFANNNLTSVTFPEGLRQIYSSAFKGNQLTSITIPSSVTRIWEEAFNDNQLPDSEAFIYDRNSNGTINNSKLVSYGGAKRENIVVPSNVINIGPSAFSEINISSVTLPSGLKTIGASAFSHNNLTSITFPEGLERIDEGAFGANRLTSVIIPNSVTSLGYSSFSSNRLTNVTIGTGITEINTYTFSSNQLTSVTIPSNVTSISNQAFANNILTSITIPSSVTSIGEAAFYKNQLTSITIPSSVTSIGNYAFNNNQLPDNQAFIYKRNSDGSIDNTTVASYGGANRTNVVVPNDVTTLAEYSFYECEITGTITLPEGITTIGDNSFVGNKFSTITIPSSITSIGNYAFYGIKSLTIKINRAENAISGAPWGVSVLSRVEWIGTN